jgi:hypothetical protein
MSLNEDILDEALLNAATPKAKDLNFPLSLEFKIGTLSNDFIAKDATGVVLGYVRQKMFKLKEKVDVFTNESRSHIAYEIKADKWIDFNTSYYFNNDDQEKIGRVGRKGMKSIWKASYSVFDHNDEMEFNITEENPWAKVADTLLGEIPLLGILTGYLFNPKYIMKRPDGTEVVRLKKLPSFWGRKFTLEKLSDFKDDLEGERALLSFMMMSLLERRRG